jgi:2-polyprenyl-3-methyl-5-hydroxy-6-metoxy-1,4-benzoquinol methylase
MITKVTGGTQENGVFVGNAYDKYNSQNPIVKNIMRGFESALEDLVELANPSTVHEVGCGEGHWVTKWASNNINVKGCDFSEKVIQLAKQNAADRGLPLDIFSVKSIYDLKADEDAADLIVCCEVLEHLENPEEALKVLKNLVRHHLIVSVPREPIWRALNLVRGKYINDLGNTPGHIQHWSKKSFVELISKYFAIKEVRTPLPWVMLLCQPKI